MTSRRLRRLSKQESNSVPPKNKIKMPTYITMRAFGLGVLLSPCILRFVYGPMDTVHGPILSTIHIFKNYFITVFSVINFQFSANKWYPNTLYMNPHKWS